MWLHSYGARPIWAKWFATPAPIRPVNRTFDSRATMLFNTLGAILSAASSALLASQTVMQPLVCSGHSNRSPVRPTTFVIASVEDRRDRTVGYGASQRSDK
jgi:hypothetical protein